MNISPISYSLTPILFALSPAAHHPLLPLFHLLQLAPVSRRRPRTFSPTYHAHPPPRPRLPTSRITGLRRYVLELDVHTAPFLPPRRLTCVARAPVSAAAPGRTMDVAPAERRARCTSHTGSRTPLQSKTYSALDHALPVRMGPTSYKRVLPPALTPLITQYGVASPRAAIHLRVRTARPRTCYDHEFAGRLRVGLQPTCARPAFQESSASALCAKRTGNLSMPQPPPTSAFWASRASPRVISQITAPSPDDDVRPGSATPTCYALLSWMNISLVVLAHAFAQILWERKRL
ncbi:hypothetical protein HYPSUDRAFT_206340 [Hypholoma sublateritium FD-334 SS-4]|uniref:Uncharacterized protein n=1 Tax=Hypholoma sublateritium (strain FD-334 SS-4) TaxID=945553 RepID=A0A0D2NE24_HYPSF|nr:hypothetical protein HYPSUDRAFT_206340 [Hypholoma sublateritium FD-334 SS-4]